MKLQSASSILSCLGVSFPNSQSPDLSAERQRSHLSSKRQQLEALAQRAASGSKQCNIFLGYKRSNIPGTYWIIELQIQVLVL